MTITDVQVFHCQFYGPECRLTVVRVDTSEPGLYGLGCATYTQRHHAVEAALKHHLGPLVIGRDPRQIEDLWHTMTVAGYWRNGPVLNNAISGIDMALWDIKGKLAGMPCYELWGGKCRAAVTVYGHAGGSSAQEVAERAQALIGDGVTHVRCQLGGYAGTQARHANGKSEFPGVYFDPKEKLRALPGFFAQLRTALGDEIELLYDVHERLAPADTIWLAKALEPYRLFFLEDVVAPEDMAWLRMLRQQSALPIAMGELFNNPQEFVPFIAERLFDFIRVHVSQIGGITPALKLAHLCEAFGIRTAWHGPGDVSPVGAAANIHLDLALHNFGIQEWALRTDDECAAFPGTPGLRGGMVYANDRPGLGIDMDESIVAQFPCEDGDLDWTSARLPDGTLWRP
jgi:mannonate dehydratase